MLEEKIVMGMKLRSLLARKSREEDAHIVRLTLPELFAHGRHAVIQKRRSAYKNTTNV